MSQLTKSPFKRIVWPLAIAQTLLWAGLYYLFPALLGAWERDLGFSKAELSGALTTALLIAAILAPLAGRAIDDGRGRVLFAGGTLMAAVLLALLSQVDQLWQFYAVWVGLGIVMAGALYEPCFAILTRYMGTNARQAITLVTLAAGFAGTIAFPSSYALVDIIGWRGVTLVFAGLIAVIAFPLVLYAVSQALTVNREPPEAPAAHTGEPLGVTQRPTFWLLGVAFAMIALNHGALITHLLALLDERSIHNEVAVLAAAMIGPMQVTGRLVMLVTEKHISPVMLSAGCCLAMVIAAIALFSVRAAPMLIVVFVIFQGAGYGVVSILRPVLVAQLLGRRRFGVVAGMLAAPFMAVFALAPTIAGMVWVVGGYDMVIAMAGAASLVGVLALTLASRMAPADTA
ncbi:MAG: MFS transporter, partial [Aestuariivirgaceae bacterium]